MAWLSLRKKAIMKLACFLEDVGATIRIAPTVGGISFYPLQEELSLRGPIPTGYKPS